MASEKRHLLCLFSHTFLGEVSGGDALTKITHRGRTGASCLATQLSHLVPRGPAKQFSNDENSYCELGQSKMTTSTRKPSLPLDNPCPFTRPGTYEQLKGLVMTFTLQTSTPCPLRLGQR